MFNVALALCLLLVGMLIGILVTLPSKGDSLDPNRNCTFVKVRDDWFECRCEGKYADVSKCYLADGWSIVKP